MVCGITIDWVVDTNKILDSRNTFNSVLALVLIEKIDVAKAIDFAKMAGNLTVL